LDKLYDAIVIGAGPAGNYVAYKLAKYGHLVIVLERNKHFGRKACCTGIIGNECYERFHIAENSVLKKVEIMKLFSPRGDSLELVNGKPMAYVVNREVFDNTLALQAQEQGAEYLMSARVKDIALGDRNIDTYVESMDGEAVIKGKVAVICSGFGSSLPKKLGLGKTGDFVLGAQKEVNVNGIDEIEVYFGQKTAPGFFAWVVPSTAGKARVGLLTRKKPGHYLSRLISELAGRDRLNADDSEMNFGGIPLIPLRKTYNERLLVVGDAAGHVKPTTGGGIYYGLLCAEIAADTVNQALAADDLSARRLSEYEAGWQKKLAKEMQIGYLARRIYENFSDSQIERIFRLISENDFHNEIINSPGFSFDWHGEYVLQAFKHKILGRTIKSMSKERFLS
jgi:geranylgeranyl reductase family protein